MEYTQGRGRWQYTWEVTSGDGWTVEIHTEIKNAGHPL